MGPAKMTSAPAKRHGRPDTMEKVAARCSLLHLALFLFVISAAI